jgi:hypothetical protein
MKRYLNVVVAGVFVSGCASVQLEGAIGDTCGTNAVNKLSLNEITLLATPSTDLLTNPIDSNSVMKGLTNALQPKARTELLIFGVDAGSNLIPWIGEYEVSKPLPTRAIEEANRARSQISHMWKWMPGVSSDSSDFRAGNVPVNQNVFLGELTADDAAFASEVERTLAAGGYDALTLGSYGELSDSLGRGDVSKLQQQAQEFNTARFISTYYRAYLRGGRNIQVALDTAELTKKISEEVVNALKSKVNLSDDQKNLLTDAIKGHLQNTCHELKDSEKKSCLLSRALGDDSFVTRAGMNVQFAGVSVTIGENGKLSPALTYPESTEFGPQLVRVAMEAVFDSHGLTVPAVSNSTACKEKLYVGTNCLSEDDTKSAGTNTASVTDSIKKLDLYAAQAEATVTAAASKLIRGASISALNNEAVAKSIETLAGVSARKIVEKTIWRQKATCSVEAGTVAVWASN